MCEIEELEMNLYEIEEAVLKLEKKDLDLKIRKLQRKINRKKFKDLMLKAEDDLDEYIEKWEEENEETDVERPIYYAELKQCKTIKEIKEYMKDFGWENE